MSAGIPTNGPLTGLLRFLLHEGDTHPRRIDNRELARAPRLHAERIVVETDGLFDIAGGIRGEMTGTRMAAGTQRLRGMPLSS
jgi:hypothetical protein